MENEVDYQSFLQLKAGIKPVIRTGTSLNGEISPGLKKLCKENNFHYIVKKFEHIFGQKLETPIYNVYISFSKTKAEQTYEYEKSGDRLNFGKMLGYPECCVGQFINNLIDGRDMTFLSYGNTKGKPSYCCNNLFNYDSKLRIKDNKIYQGNFSFLNKYRDLFLIRHVPCAYDCEKSIELGRETLKLIEKDDVKLANKIVAALKSIVLYFDYFNWVIFDGKVNANKITYKRTLPFDSLISKKTINMINKGNNLELKEDMILVYQDKKQVFDLPVKDKNKNAIILDFS